MNECYGPESAPLNYDTWEQDYNQARERHRIAMRDQGNAYANCREAIRNWTPPTL